MKNQLIDMFKNSYTMQLATVSSGRPWASTVYFVHDSNLNLYWLSWPTRRHSKDIADNPHVAVAIQVKTDLPVIGIQSEGRAEIVSDKKIIKKIMDRYIDKYGSGEKFYDRYLEGTNEHVMYRFSPKRYEIFDDKNPSKNSKLYIDIN